MTPEEQFSAYMREDRKDMQSMIDNKASPEAAATMGVGLLLRHILMTLLRMKHNMEKE